MLGSRALFAGGGQGGLTTGGAFTTVDVYDEALTRTVGTPLSTKRFFPAGATVGGHALFAGGTPRDGSLVVDAYDASLTLTAAADLSSAQNSYAAAAVGGYALFAGDTADARMSTTPPSPKQRSASSARQDSRMR